MSTGSRIKSRTDAIKSIYDIHRLQVDSQDLVCNEIGGGNLYVLIDQIWRPEGDILHRSYNLLTIRCVRVQRLTGKIYDVKLLVPIYLFRAGVSRYQCTFQPIRS